MSEARVLQVGDGVVYRPHPSAAAEDGVVTKIGETRVLAFVRYSTQHPGAEGIATTISDLTLTSGEVVE